jgi:hypothetical protein
MGEELVIDYGEISPPAPKGEVFERILKYEIIFYRILFTFFNIPISPDNLL